MMKKSLIKEYNINNPKVSLYCGKNLIEKSEKGDIIPFLLQK